MRNIPTISAEARKGRKLKKSKVPKDLIYPIHGVPPINGTSNAASQKDMGQHLHHWYRDQ